MSAQSLSVKSRSTANRGRSGLYKSAITLLVIEFFLIFPPMIILGGAINWPASLDEPAAVNLPLILEQYPAVMVGYSIYLLYSLLFWPVGYFTGRVIVGNEVVGNEVENGIFRIASGFAALSAIARALGIVRWLFAMPGLARLYTDPATSPELQASISVVYDMLNAYAGGIGELLGVSLFAAIWLTLMGVLLLRSPEWPSWLGYFGFVAAASLFVNLLNMINIDTGPMVVISVTLLHFWMLAMAIAFWRKRA